MWRGLYTAAAGMMTDPRASIRMSIPDNIFFMNHSPFSCSLSTLFVQDILSSAPPDDGLIIDPGLKTSLKKPLLIDR